MNPHTEEARNRRIKHLVIAGWSIDKIRQDTGIPTGFINAYFKNIMHQPYSESLGVCFGAKTEPYYSPEKYSEEDLINFSLEYNLEDLSEAEKEIYNNLPESKENWKEKIRALNTKKNEQSKKDNENL